MPWTASRRRPSTWYSDEPVERVVDEEPPYLVAVGSVEVDGVAPRRVVAVGEVGPEGAEVVTLGAEVVVDDVEDQRETVGVAGVDQALEALRPAVGGVGGEQLDAVVTPIAFAREPATGMSSMAVTPRSRRSAAARPPAKVPSGENVPTWSS